MKKFGWTALLALALVLALAGSALAATTGLAVDGKVYTFTGDVTSFEADGKTFIIEGETLRVQEPGKADRVLPLEMSTEQSVMVQDFAADVATEIGYAQGTVAIEADSEVHEAIASTLVTQVDNDRQYPNYDAYARFGLSYDAREDVLYYQGQRVRVFQDSYPLEGNSCSMMENFDPAGTIDVEAQRDLSTIVYNADGSQNPGGTLTGLRVLDAAAFAARDLTPWTDPPESTSTAVSSEGDPMTPAEKQAFYAPYAELGILYDAATDRLSYQGQSIRRFLDVQQSNGESFSGGRFKGSMTSMSYDDGDIDVTILRDYTQPDAEGNGRITGVHTENVR